MSNATEPDPGSLGELLLFENLTMLPGYGHKGRGQMTSARWAATGITSPSRIGRSSSTPAATS